MTIAQKIRCREITEADLGAVADLLARGFYWRSRDYWMRGLRRQAERQVPAGYPRFGYMIDNSGVPAGVLLQIYTARNNGAGAAIYCNLSSWYVDPAFRAFAPLLVSRALRPKDVTFINVSPARHTWPILEAQGFSRICDGAFFAVPLLSGWFGGAKIKVLDGRQKPQVSFEARDQEVLSAHAAHGCITFWCTTAERAFPFVFRRRFVRGFVPYAQLIYCSDVTDFVRCAGPLGWALARRGLPFVMIDANAPIPGLSGWYSPGMPKYFKGPQRPRLGDIAYTEYGVLGV